MELIDFVMVDTDDDEFIFLNSDGGEKKNLKNKNPNVKLRKEYVDIIYKMKVLTTQMKRLVTEMEIHDISGNRCNLWMNATTCVIDCVQNTIEQGNKLIVN